MHIMAYHSICDTISYGPKNVTAKTMDGLISSHYLFHGKLQSVHILYEKLVSVEMSFGRESPDERQPRGPPCILRFECKPESTAFFIAAIEEC